jgi:hypothetical protein
VCNFPPNNWESDFNCTRLVNVTWAADGLWHSKVLTELPFGSARTFSKEDACPSLPDDTMPLLSLTTAPLPEQCLSLPRVVNGTSMPSWRATLGLISSSASTSYQGELDPFPETGSLLTFGPFIQFGSNIENFVLLLNIEMSPVSRTSKIDVHDSAEPNHLKISTRVRNNSISALCLDGLHFDINSLPVVSCKGMSGIPLYFSKTSDGSFLSIEHTHPPASYVIHGDRWNAQRVMKKKWFDKLA